MVVRKGYGAQAVGKDPNGGGWAAISRCAAAKVDWVDVTEFVVRPGRNRPVDRPRDYEASLAPSLLCTHLPGSPMLTHRTIPQELIDQVIDELGDAYQDPDDRLNAGKALHACALTSKNWTDRSRAYLFRVVEIRGDEEAQFPIPPQSLMPYVEKLEIKLLVQKFRIFPTPDILTPFHTAPIAHLGITEGGLATGEARPCLVECIAALSATLQTVTFRSCSLSPRLVSDIISAHPGLGRIHVLSCSFNSDTDPIPPAVSHPVMRLEPPDLELLVVSGDASTHHFTVAAFAQLPNRFGSLNFEHFLFGPLVNMATDVLIQANAESLTSLQVHIITRTSTILETKSVL